MLDVTRVTDRLPPRARRAVDLAVATARDAAEDRVTGLAAEIAFWVILALPPMLIAAVATAGLIGDSLGADVRTQLVARIGELAGQVFSSATVERTITPALDGLLEEGSPSVLSLSFLVTVVSASRAFWVVVHAISIAYDLEDARPTWMSRVIGLVFTLASLVLGLILIPVVVAGPRLGELIEARLGLNMMLAETWRLAYWPASLVIVTLLLGGLYHFATPWSTPFRRDLPGAVLATVLALLSSVGLRFYTNVAFSGEGVYAPLAAPLALLVFLWLQGLALLMGAELNAEIEKADPVGTPAPDPPSLADIGRRGVDRLKRLRRG